MKNEQKQSKPKGKEPSLIGGANGKPRLAMVKRQCNCARCHCVLSKGTACAEIPKLGGFASYPRYCSACYSRVLDQTAKDLAGLRTLLDDGG
jgi:hypothetical protein